MALLIIISKHYVHICTQKDDKERLEEDISDRVTPSESASHIRDHFVLYLILTFHLARNKKFCETVRHTCTMTK